MMKKYTILPTVCHCSIFTTPKWWVSGAACHVDPDWGRKKIFFCGKKKFASFSCLSYFVIRLMIAAGARREQKIHFHNENKNHVSICCSSSLRAVGGTIETFPAWFWHTYSLTALNSFERRLCRLPLPFNFVCLYAFQSKRFFMELYLRRFCFFFCLLRI